MEEKKTRIKFIVVGNCGTGKSSLIHYFVNDTVLFNHEPTIGVDFLLRTIDDKNLGKIDFLIWDTAGAEKFNTRNLCDMYYRGAHGIILLFDVTSRESFDAIPNTWLGRLNKVNSMHEGCKYILVGNKIDLDDQRVVSRDEALALAFDKHMTYMELSSIQSNPEEIRKPFLHLAIQLIDDGICQPKITLNENTSLIYNTDSTQQSFCCST